MIPEILTPSQTSENGDARPIDREPLRGLELSVWKRTVCVGDCVMRLSAASLRLHLNLLPLLSGRGGLLRVRRLLAAMRNNDAPRAARRWISGLFFGLGFSLRRTGRESVPAMRDV